jgi:hypothetical protein
MRTKPLGGAQWLQINGASFLVALRVDGDTPACQRIDSTIERHPPTSKGTAMRATITVVCFCLLGIDGALGCEIPPYKWSDGFVSTVKITVKKNEQNCISRMYVGSTVIHSVGVIKHATHGAARVLRLSNWAYRPQAGFVGGDSFTLEINYEKPSTGNAVNATLNVEVDVVDH